MTKGSAQCNELSVNAFQTLLAGAGPCDQQNAADELVSYSKQLNSPQMVALAQLFSQQARNAVSPIPLTQCISYQTDTLFHTAQLRFHSLLSTSSSKSRAQRVVPMSVQWKQSEGICWQFGGWTTWNHSIWYDRTSESPRILSCPP